MRPDTSAAATRSRVRNRRGQGDRLRDEIVTAAVDLLDEAGDAGAVTLRSVARRVGIAAPSIYRHFPDQPAIMLAVVRNAFAELDEQLGAADTAAGTSAQAAADTATGTAVEAAADTAANPAEHSAANPAEDSAGDAPRERLTALCHSYLAFARAHPGRYRAMFGGLWTPDLDASSVTEEDVATLGQASMRRLAEALGGCVAMRPRDQHRSGRRRGRALARSARSRPPAGGRPLLPLAAGHRRAGHHRARALHGRTAMRRSGRAASEPPNRTDDPFAAMM